MGWLGFSGRCNKQQYWVMVALLFVAPVLANMVHLPVTGAEAFWLVLYARRLHDFGKTLWWAVGVVLLSLVPLVLLAAVEGASFRDLILQQGVDDSGHRSLAYLAAIGCAFLIQHVFTVWLGLQKGDEGQNRFGMPKKSWGSTRPAPTSGEPSIWEARLWEDEEPGAPTMTPAPPRGASPVAARYATSNPRPVFGRRASP
ncbi:MAG TPA: DUF805 domain-containing protein [Caulobacteraceae bacterium]|nr:DUF805 domain-containing protein [Caulobacteraceae bacterium]